MEISIVIPIFRPNSKYLNDLFQSIEQQIYREFEVVISDDGDAEDLVKYIIPDRIKDKIIYIKNQSQKGIFGNLNNGIRHANGKYIQIFCQDDVMLPGLLEANYFGLLKNKESELAFTHFDAITESGELSSFRRTELNYIPTIINSQEANNYFLYFGCLPGNLSPVMIKKSLFDKAGVFNENYHCTGDFEFWIRASKYTSIYFNKEKHLLVRNHDESAAHILGTFEKYKEMKTITQYLINNNTIPISKNILRRYLHFHIFRSVFLYSIRKVLTFKKLNWDELIQIFDGNPFSLWIAFLAFIRPIPEACKPLQKIMEVNRK